MATETEIYRIIVETQGGRELLTLNRTMKQLGTTTQQTAKQTTLFSNALGKTNRSVGQRNNALTNVSYQIADIAVQLELGTDAGRVFAQQMPQLLGGFGLLGAAVGAVAAIVPTVIRLLNRGMVDSLKKVDSQLETVSESLQDFIEFSEKANVSAKEFGENFGANNSSIRSFVQNLQELKRIKLEDDLESIASILNQLTSRQTVLGFGTGPTRAQKIRDDLLELGSAIKSSERRELVEFISLLKELENPGTTDDRRILLYRELNRRIIEAAGGLNSLNSEQEAFVKGASEAALAYQKIVTEREKEEAAVRAIEGLNRRSYEESSEQARQEQILAEQTERRANQARYLAGYTQQLNAEREKEIKITERAIVEQERYARTLQQAAELDKIEERANQARQFAAYTQQLGAAQEKNAAITQKQIAAHKQYAESLEAAIKLETTEERANKARQLAALTQDMARRMAEAASETARLQRELQAAARAGELVANSIRNIQSASASINLSNIGREAQLAALRAGETVEFARAASEIAQEEAKLTEALQSARSTGQIAAASAELEAFKNAKQAELELDKSINAEIEKRNKLNAAGGGGAGGASSSLGTAQEINLLRDAIQSTYTPMEQATMEAQRLEQALLAVGQSSKLWIEYPDGVERVRQAIEDLRQTTSTWQTEFAEGIGASIGNGLADLAFQAESTGDAFKNMAKTILQELGKILAKWLTYKILTAGFGFDVASPFASSSSSAGASSGVSAASSSSFAARAISSPSLGTQLATSAGSAVGSAAGSVIGRQVVPASSARSAAKESTTTQVVVNNNAPNTVASAQQQSDGKVYVTVDEVRSLVSNDIVNGGNNIAASIERTYKMSRGR